MITGQKEPSSAFDQAWDSITKFDFYMNPISSEFGSYASPQQVMGNKAPQVSINPIYPIRAAQNEEQERMARLYGPQYGPAYQPPVSDMSNTVNYRTGASEPRLSDDGSFAGVNLSNLDREDFTDDSKWNENVQDLAAIGAHETVHRLINDEIEPWAMEQVGYEKPDELSGLKGLHALAAQMSQESGLQQKRAKSNYGRLRSLGHEFGAWSLTPDAKDESGFTSPDTRREKMSKYRKIGPFVRGVIPFSELRLKRKSESMNPFDQAWALVKNEEWDDDDPLPYDTDKYHDQEKIDEIQRILDDIAQRNYEESQAREPTDIEELMQMVEEYEDTGYDGPTDSGELWDNRWNIPPPAAGWRMFADSASEYNVEHLLNSGWDPEHIRIIRLGPGEHTPWGYMGGQDTVWVSSASPEFNQTMARYVRDEPEDYDPWRAME